MTKKKTIYIVEGLSRKKTEIQLDFATFIKYNFCEDFFFRLE